MLPPTKFFFELRTDLADMGQALVKTLLALSIFSLLWLLCSLSVWLAVHTSLRILKIRRRLRDEGVLYPSALLAFGLGFVAFFLLPGAYDAKGQEQVFPILIILVEMFIIVAGLAIFGVVIVAVLAMVKAGMRACSGVDHTETPTMIHEEDDPVKEV